MDGHLVLGRKEGESVSITHDGKRIEVIVEKARNGRTTLRFKGDQEMRVVRGEIEGESRAA